MTFDGKYIVIPILIKPFDVTQILMKPFEVTQILSNLQRWYKFLLKQFNYFAKLLTFLTTSRSLAKTWKGQYKAMTILQGVLWHFRRFNLKWSLPDGNLNRCSWNKGLGNNHHQSICNALLGFSLRQTRVLQNSERLSMQQMWPDVAEFQISMTTKYTQILNKLNVGCSKSFVVPLPPSPPLNNLLWQPTRP
jgi:hypothetical protein